MSHPCAVITGASRGLGSFLAKRFWESGYSLVLVSRNVSDLNRVCDDLGPRPGQQASFFSCDLAIPEEVNSLVAAIKGEFKEINVLVNNAAIHGPIGPLSTNKMSEWDKVIQVNLLAPVHLCSGLAPLMKKGGAIINISGGGATGPRENFTAYASSKTALVRFSEILAVELQKDGIRVNCIAPGAMKTALLGEVLEVGAAASGSKEHDVAQNVFSSGGTSMQDISDLALFLASSKSAGITGKLISAVWDNWKEWPLHINDLSSKDLFTLRRIAGRDRDCPWGDR